jgi:Tol biopolymer transport system component/DNA-binding winged helix-turn-helix (wHTH) protein
LQSGFRLGLFHRILPALNTIEGPFGRTHIEPKVMEVLQALAERPGDVLSKERLIARVWAGTNVTDDVLTRSISELRRTLGDDAREPHFIETIPKRGYRLVAAVTPLEAAGVIDPSPLRDRELVGPSSIDIVPTVATPVRVSTGEPNPDVATLHEQGGTNRRQLQRWARTLGMLLGLAALLSAALGVLLRWTGRREDTDRAGRVALRMVPVANDVAAEFEPSWSPDGKTLAYVAAVGGKFQIFARALSASKPVQLTPAGSSHWKSSPFWSPDGTRVYYIDTDLYSVGAAGGEPELAYRGVDSAAFSRDGKVMALLRRDAGPPGVSLWFASPPGKAPQPYVERPFANRHFGTGVVRFSPRGDKLIAWMWTEGEPTEFWVIPLPRGRPFRVLARSTADALFPTPFDVLVDGRHLVLEIQPRPDWTQHLFVADLERDALEPLTRTTVTETQPAVSPDGERIAFTARDANYDIVRVPLDRSPMLNVLATAWSESYPTWAPNGEFAYACDRLAGSLDIWVHDPRSGSNRPAVTREHFGGADSIFYAPAVSPDGEWVAYERYERHGRPTAVWISPFAGGTPIALTPGSQERTQSAPAWSPDGKWIAYGAGERGRVSVLEKARVGSRRPPLALYEGVLGAIAWSPGGRWIVADTGGGLTLVDPDGRANRVLTTDDAPLVFGWSANDMLIYGLRTKADRLLLVSIDAESGHEKTVADVGPAPRRPPPHYLPATLSGFSLSADGRSFLTSVNRSGADIWILEGFTRNP